MTRAKTTLIALAAAVALPSGAAAATPQASVYTLVKASGTMVVTFTSDEATCQRFTTCGDRGTITYRFGGPPKRGRLTLTADRRGRVEGFGAFGTRGTTRSSVVAGASCTDTVRHRDETFSLVSHSRLGRLLFTLHGGATDFLATDCAGPTEDDLEHDRALPQGTFKRADFEQGRTSFRLTGSSPFNQSGFKGQVRWNLGYKVIRSACSPHCRVPNVGTQ